MARTVSNVASEAREATSGFKPYPAGDYITTIVDVETGTFKSAANSGVPKLDVQFRIEEPTEVGDRQVFGKKFKDFGIPDQPKWKNGNVAFMYYQFYKALGVDFSKDGEVELPDYEDMLGEQIGVKLEVVQKVKDGKPQFEDDGVTPVLQNNVKGYFPASEGIKNVPAAGADDEFTLD
jgi:hypothetical protein